MSPRWGAGLPAHNAEMLEIEEAMIIAQALGALYDTNLVQTGVMTAGPAD